MPLTSPLTTTSNRPAAHRIKDLVAQGPLSLSSLQEAIASGALRVRKYGRTTIILDEDWLAFLRALPVGPDRSLTAAACRHQPAKAADALMPHPHDPKAHGTELPTAKA